MTWKDVITWNRKKGTSKGSHFPTRQSEHHHPFLSLHREMNRLFDHFFRNFEDFPLSPFWEERFSPLLGERSSPFSPKINVSENDKEIEITAEIPGMDQDDIDVTLTDNIITIKGEKTREKEEQNKEYYHVERSYGSFKRSLQLPCEIEEDKIDASFKKGVLKITLPKCETAQRNIRKIPLKGE